MSIHIVNKSFSNQITRQIKAFLTETGLVQTTNRGIQTTVRPTDGNVKKHLRKFLDNDANYSRFYSLLSENRTILNFDIFKEDPPKIWRRIAKYPVFKQWSELYQYIGYGFLMNTYQFIPSSAITTNLVHDVRFMESSFKCLGDPRMLTGFRTLHSECDYFAWTKGEDRLPITSNTDILPRIPKDKILKYWEDHKLDPDTWQNALLLGTKNWQQMVNDMLSSKFPFELEILIFTSKKLIDLFLYGEFTPNDDFIDKEQVYRIKNRWESLKHFVISIHFWRSLPKLYRDITRLYWGAFYLRNSLKRPMPEPSFDIRIFETELNDFNELHIRCFRSKRSFQSIYQAMMLLYKSLKRLLDKNVHQLYQTRSQSLYNRVYAYLPSNSIDISELLRDLDEYLVMEDDEKELLISNSKIELPLDIPEQPILQLCHFVCLYNKLKKNKQVKILTDVQAQLKKIESKYITEIRHYDYDQKAWNLTCQNLKNLVELNRSI